MHYSIGDLKKGYFFLFITDLILDLANFRWEILKISEYWIISSVVQKLFLHVLSLLAHLIVLSLQFLCLHVALLHPFLGGIDVLEIKRVLPSQWDCSVITPWPDWEFVSSVVSSSVESSHSQTVTCWTARILGILSKNYVLTLTVEGKENEQIGLSVVYS